MAADDDEVGLFGVGVAGVDVDSAAGPMVEALSVQRGSRLRVEGVGLRG